MSVKIGGKVLGAKEQPNTEKAKPAPKAKKRKYVTRRAYPPHVFERLFEYVAAGEDLTTACKHPNMPTPWTVRRRMQVDEVLAEQFKAAYRIHVHGAVDRLLRLPREALEGKVVALAGGVLANDGFKLILAPSQLALLYEQFASATGGRR